MECYWLIGIRNCITEITTIGASQKQNLTTRSAKFNKQTEQVFGKYRYSIISQF